MRGRRIRMVPAGFHTSQLDLTTGLKVSVKTKFFCTIILRLGKIIKPFCYTFLSLWSSAIE
jgi:hypothetical protein